MTTMRFPIRVDPVPGEAFDSWIDAYAQRLLMPGRDLASALGIPEKLVRLRGCNVAKGDPNLDAEQIAQRACDIDPAAVRALWFGLAPFRAYRRCCATPSTMSFSTAIRRTGSEFDRTIPG